MIYLLKGCQRCCGDLYSSDDIYGKYIACLQCGHYLSEQQVVDLNSPGLGLEVTASPAVPTSALAELAV
jgi:hypothetical protein